MKRFVANRVEHIRTVKNCEFHYVNTSHNPADYSTRGKDFEELVCDKMWWHGPTWLKKDRTEWPEYRVPSISDERIASLKKEMKPVTITQTLAVSAHNSMQECSMLGICPSRFSSLGKLLRVTTYVLKFLKRKIWSKLSITTHQNQNQLSKIFEPVSENTGITTEEFSLSKALWTRSVQANHFSGEVSSICSGSQRSRKSQFGLQLGNRGILRSHSRFANADLPPEVRHPKLLSKKCAFTKLVVQDVPTSKNHARRSLTHSE